jgi:hypothetical protein
MTDNTQVPNLAIGDILHPESLGIIFELECEAAVTKGDPVYLSSDNKVSPATAAQDCIGIATKSGAIGDVVSIAGSGNRVKVKAGGSITRGKAVYGGDASKRILQFTDQLVNEGGSGNYTIYFNRKLGWAMEASAGADDLITIFLEK